MNSEKCQGLGKTQFTPSSVNESNVEVAIVEVAISPANTNALERKKGDLDLATTSLIDRELFTETTIISNEVHPSEFTETELSEMRHAIYLMKGKAMPARNGTINVEKINELYASPFLKEESMLALKDQCIEILSMPSCEMSEGQKAQQICQITSAMLEPVSTINRNLSRGSPKCTPPYFDEIMKHRMDAAIYFESKKREILRELASEKLFRATYAYAYAIGEDYLHLIYLSFNDHFKNVIESLKGLENYRIWALQKVINLVTNELVERERTRNESFHFGSNLQNMRGLVNFIEDLNLVKLQKMQLIVYAYTNMGFHRRSQPGEYPELDYAKAYIAGLQKESF